MNTELVIEGMTWGELRAFVALGEHMADEEEVGIGRDQLGNFETESLWLPMRPARKEPTA